MPTRSHPVHRPVSIPRADVPAGACLCDYCIGKCCRYISLPIKTPVTWDDFDEVRWFLAHGKTVVYQEKGIWYLLMMGDCQYLTADNRCAIYHDRPRICDEYTTADCEYDTDWTFEQVFEVPEQVVEYAEAILPPRKRKAHRPAPSGLTVLNPAPSPRRLIR